MIRQYKAFSIIITILLCTIALLSAALIKDHLEERGRTAIVPAVRGNASVRKTNGQVAGATDVHRKLRQYSLETNGKYKVSFINFPLEGTVGNNAPFVWLVEGLVRKINTTSVYCGAGSVPVVSDSMAPADTIYTFAVQDFLNGSFMLPMQFTGNIFLPVAGEYYCRAYAYIDGEHYWSRERSFTVKKVNTHEITVVDPPSHAKTGGNMAFTWEIAGPAAKTSSTAIVMGSQSKPGILAPTVDIPQTAYAVIVNDFTASEVAIPLRFIGNAKVPVPGEYYYRAVARIDGKNVWSEEHKLVVE